MNKKSMVGIALIVVAAVMSCVIVSSAGEVAVRLVGKAVWYFPYVAIVGGVRFLACA